MIETVCRIRFAHLRIQFLLLLVGQRNGSQKDEDQDKTDDGRDERDPSPHLEHFNHGQRNVDGLYVI